MAEVGSTCRFGDRRIGLGLLYTTPAECLEGRCSQRRTQSLPMIASPRPAPLSVLRGFPFGGLLCLGRPGAERRNAQGSCSRQALAQSIGLIGRGLAPGKQWNHRASFPHLWLCTDARLRRAIGHRAKFNSRHRVSFALPSTLTKEQSTN